MDRLNLLDQESLPAPSTENFAWSSENCLLECYCTTIEFDFFFTKIGCKITLEPLVRVPRDISIYS